MRRVSLLRSVEKDSFCVRLPELPAQFQYLPEQLYQYWWVAENIQYYGLPLYKYQFRLSKTKTKYLGDTQTFAIIHLDYSFEDYFTKAIKSPERALIRKAMKSGITCRPIDYDDYLGDVLSINLSKEERGGRTIAEDYRNLHFRDRIVKSYGARVYSFGAFSKDGVLVAYYMFEQVTNFLHVVKGIGHKDYLKYGVMNYLFAYSISELSSYDVPHYAIYGRLFGDTLDGLSRFKKNIGCKAQYLRISGTSKQFAALDYYNTTYRLHGDTSMNYILDYCDIPSDLKSLYVK